MSLKKYIIEIRYHSLLSAILVGIIFSSVYTVHLFWGQPHEFENITSSSLLSNWVYYWQLEYKLLSTILTGGIMAYLAIKLGQMTLRYNLYGVTSYLSMELYPLLVMGVMINVSSLKMAFVSILILFSISRYMSSYRAVNCAGALLSGGFALGGAALMYPPAILLWLVTPVMVVLFDRTTREVIVAIVALLIVPFAAIYIEWLMGGDFLDLVGDFIAAITSKSGFSILDSFNGVSIIMLALILYMTINAIFAISLLENTVKAKRRLRLISVYAVTSIAMLMLPSADSSVFGLFAISSSLLIPITMIKLGRMMSLILFVALLVGMALTIFGL